MAWWRFWEKGAEGERSQILAGANGSDQREGEGDDDPLLGLFLDEFNSLKGHIENSAREWEIHLSARFEREFTYCCFMCSPLCYS
jgi:hypothetical protein